MWTTNYNKNTMNLGNPNIQSTTQPEFTMPISILQTCKRPIEDATHRNNTRERPKNGADDRFCELRACRNPITARHSNQAKQMDEGSNFLREITENGRKKK